MRKDFDEMFADVVTRQPSFTARVLRALVDGPRSAAELAAPLGMEKGGRISDALEQLAEAGLAAPDEALNPATGRPARQKRFRLRDNYTRFYLKHIEPAKSAIDARAFAFGGLDRLEGWDATMGPAFENLVVNNYRSLLAPLGLGAAQLLSAAPFRRAGNRNAPRKGVQIDLLLQTRRSVCLVEIKRRREIGREIEEEMDRKVRLLPRRPGLSVRTALVYEGHLAPVVEADAYFDALIPFKRLLAL